MPSPFRSLLPILLLLVYIPKMSGTGTAPPVSTGSTKLDAIKQTIQASEPQKLTGLDLYSRFAFAGAVCCSVTHGALTPVDV